MLFMWYGIKKIKKTGINSPYLSKNIMMSIKQATVLEVNIFYINIFYFHVKKKKTVTLKIKQYRNL